jgi:hypothetical protein
MKDEAGPPAATLNDYGGVPPTPLALHLRCMAVGYGGQQPISIACATSRGCWTDHRQTAPRNWCSASHQHRRGLCPGLHRRDRHSDHHRRPRSSRRPCSLRHPCHHLRHPCYQLRRFLRLRLWPYCASPSPDSCRSWIASDSRGPCYVPPAWTPDHTASSRFVNSVVVVQTTSCAWMDVLTFGPILRRQGSDTGYSAISAISFTCEPTRSKPLSVHDTYRCCLLPASSLHRRFRSR